MTELQKALEPLIDKHGIADVLQAIVAICDAKAEDIAVNWQDAPLAKRWAKLANALMGVSVKGIGL